MKTETRNTEPRGPSRADIRRDLANRARHWFDLWENEGFYVDNVRKLRLLNLPSDCIAVVAPWWAAFVLIVLIWGVVIWTAIQAAGR